MHPDTDDEDPPPQAPVLPDLDDCCGQGCEPCIFDLHEQARERHEQALRDWQARQDSRAGCGTPPSGDAR